MKNIIILITLIFISCKNEKKAEKEKSIEIIVSDTIIEQEKKTDLTENLNPKDIALDSIWLNKIFKDTPLTSDSGEFYSGYKSKVYRMTSDTLQNKKLNTYRKEVGIEDGTLSETYNGNPPHRAKGAISQAWNVASVVAAFKMVQKYENK